MEYFNLVDYLYGPLALVFVVMRARLKKYKLIEEHPEYKYYSWGLYFKLLGGLSLCLIYAVYYGGGDTLNYYMDGVTMMKLFFSDFGGFLVIMRDGLSISNVFYFNESTGYPIYFRDDAATFYVVRIAAPIIILSAGSFIVSTIIFATISYMGTWKLYQVFVMEFPALKKEMAIAILFIPSVYFWGSGIMKDTITLTCVGFYTYSFYMVFIRNEKLLANVVTIFISTFFILMIKPYIIFALLPGSIIWFVNKHVGSIKSQLIKVLIGPVFLALAILGGYLVLDNMGDLLGGYSVDNVMEKAVVTNLDLKADYYGGNSFDIGAFDPTISSMLSKAPVAIIASIYRPFLWEVNNIVMFMSALECFVILIFTIRVLIKVRLIGFFSVMMKNHLLSFSLIFSLFFAFSVGISTSNFGSLVRYRIPVFPFFIASLYIIQYLYQNKKSDNIEEGTEIVSENSGSNEPIISS